MVATDAVTAADIRSSPGQYRINGSVSFVNSVNKSQETWDGY